jgi:hypothetical protein
VAAACVCTLIVGLWKPVAPLPGDVAVAQPIDWGAPQAKKVPPERPELNVGVYVTNINNIDLLDDQFSIEMLLWTEWAGDPAANPSDDLMVLNGIYDGDIQRFERVSRENRLDTTWSLYRVRSSVVKHWRLQRYPFDTQILHVNIGLENPLQPVNLGLIQENSFSINPGLLLSGWSLDQPSSYVSSISLMSDLGQPPEEGVVIRRQSTVSFDLPIQRRSLLFVAPDFLGYMLAVGLCCMSLLITHSRDDLILAAVVSAGGNYVFIAGNLPVTAMTGFIGNLQLIIFLGILYVVAADEMIDNQLTHYSQRISRILRVLLLPSYVGITILAIALIIP